ncbi:hypothetical protein FQN54_001748 [Arachnomyces sp. PD_36]|nr:hypothetical protein FQN54_001748 [Arachnomyces sp. PD_36]
MSTPTDNPLYCWNINAAFWDELMGDGGNDYFTDLELPALERMSAIQGGERALDLATGNGLVARWLAAQGAGSVIGTDGSEKMVEHARKRGVAAYGEDTAGGKMSYQVLDVTDEKALEEFIEREVESGGGGFDIITMNMAIMDIPTLDPIAAALPRLLRNGGRFIATLLHPLFFTSGASRLIEVGDDPISGSRQITQSIKVTKYLHVTPAKGVFLDGQPVPQIYHHRPLHSLLSPFLKTNSLVLDSLEEPNFDLDEEGRERARVAQRLEAARNFTQIPKILAFRLRKVVV